MKGLIQIKVSFEEIALETNLQTHRNVHRELHDNLIVMHDLDISVDCGSGVHSRHDRESYHPSPRSGAKRYCVG